MFERLYTAAGRHRNKVCICLALLIGLSLAGLYRVRFVNSIEDMLPADRDVRRSIEFFRDSNISDTLVLSLNLSDGSDDVTKLIGLTDRLAHDLRAGELVTDVIATVAVDDMRAGVTGLLDSLPQVTNADEYDSAVVLDEARIRQRVAAIYRQLLQPGPSPALPYLLADPLGLGAEVMDGLKRLSASSAYAVNLRQGHLVSRDGRHTMLVVKTPVRSTDGDGARKLMAFVESRFIPYAGELDMRIVSGHRHTLSNEDRIRRDVNVTLLVAGLAFILLFLLVFRDPRAMYIFLMPAGAILIAIASCALLPGGLSSVVAGFAAVIAGIAIDYGIHVYVARRRGARVSVVARPVAAGAITTIAVFSVFLISSVSGYRQLACFSIVSILLCLGFSLFVLPHLLKPGETGGSSAVLRCRSRAVIVIWFVMMSVLGWSAAGGRFDTDVRRFDGSTQNVFDDESAFQKVWGRDNPPAALVVEAENREKALALNDEVFRQARRLTGGDTLESIAVLLQSRQTREHNVEAWNRFWTAERVREAQEKILRIAGEYGFAADAFDDFFALLNPATVTEHAAIEPVAGLSERFIIERPGRVRIASYFDDTPQFRTALAPLIVRDDVYIVSRGQLSESISSAVAREMIRLASAAAALIVAVVLWLLPGIRAGVMALVPVLTALAAVFGILPFLNLAATPVTLVAAMVVTGLCIDYGIFVVHQRFHGYDSGTRCAVTLSAITTLIGAGALLFARHPVMFSIGLTIVTGVAAGYAAAMWVVPALCDMTGVGSND